MASGKFRSVVVSRAESGSNGSVHCVVVTRSAVAVLLGAMLLAGCSGGGLFGSEDARPQRIAIDESALTEESAPPLTSVPTEAPTVTSPEERERLLQELREDRAQAQGRQLAANGGSDLTSRGAAQPSQQATASQGSQREGAELAAVIQFARDSDALDSRDRSILEDVARLQRERGTNLLVVGHASARTAQMTRERQLELHYDISQRRADAVARALRDAGVAPGVLFAQAMGADAQLYQESMPSGEVANQRVEIYLF